MKLSASDPVTKQRDLSPFGGIVGMHRNLWGYIFST